MPTVEKITLQLKNNMEATERLRLRRKEIKNSLLKEVPLSEKEEALLAKELASVSEAIFKLESTRQTLCEQLGSTSP